MCAAKRANQPVKERNNRDMDNQLKRKQILFSKRKLRVRKRVRGDASRPRLSVFKSNEHLYVQLIDDQIGKTLAGICTSAKFVKEANLTGKSKESAAFLGTAIAERARSQNIEKVVFDRGPYPYHGLIATLADAARAAGLLF